MSHPYGRQPIGLNQPPFSGTNYPFIDPPDQIPQLFADFFVSYEPGLVSSARLKVAWLYGFGTVANLPIPGRPTPVHDYDLVLEDENSTVIIDTTTAGSYFTEAWDGRLLIIEWRAAEYMVRAVIHTEWDPAESLTAPEYDLHIAPVDAFLEPHTLYELPPNVTAIVVGAQTLTNPTIVLDEGYNVSLEVAANSAFPGIQQTTTLNPATRIRLSAIPGAGLGVFPGCVDEPPELKTINNVAGDSHQNFTLDAEGCIRIQRPVSLTSTDPRTVNYAATGLTAAEAAAALSFGNGCKPCCDCAYFVRTYKGLKRQWQLHKNTAAAVESVRDDYREIVARWVSQKTCRETNTTRSTASADGNSKVSWGVVHCNASKCCLLNVSARLTWIYKVNGVAQLPGVPGYDCQKSVATGSIFNDKTTRIYSGRSADTQGIVNVFTWDRADGQSTTTIAGRHCFPEAETIGDDVLQVQPHWCIMWDTALPDADTGENCDYPLLAEIDYPADVKAMWLLTGDSVPTNGRSQFLGDPVTIRTDDPYCERCDCETPVPTTPVTPKRFPSICHWLDAADERTITLDGSNVVEWRSKRGNVITLTPPPGESPPTLQDGLITFNGVDQSLYNEFYQLSYKPGFVAAVYSAAGLGQFIITSTVSGTASENFRLRSDSGRMGSVESTATIDLDELGILVCTAAGVGSSVSQSLYYNGTLADGDVVDRSGILEGVYVGVDSFVSGGRLEGGIGEILVGCITLTTLNRQIIEGYLAWKWGLQSKLPPDHPYKNAAPVT